jgi:beta-lactam-binding protein with PASTA domain
MLDIPGVSLGELPGTIVEQRPPAGVNIVTSTAVDVTVFSPGPD